MSTLKVGYYSWLILLLLFFFVVYYPFVIIYQVISKTKTKKMTILKIDNNNKENK